MFVFVFSLEYKTLGYLIIDNFSKDTSWQTSFHIVVIQTKNMLGELNLFHWVERMSVLKFIKTHFLFLRSRIGYVFL